MSTAPTGPRGRPIGSITRGTTNPNRLRRCDRWLVGTQAWRLRAAPGPVVVDLGFGASPVTVLELRDRLRAVTPLVDVVGIEIDAERVRAASPFAGPGLSFAVGGFEVPLPQGRRPSVIRAFNVLRQYDESEVAGAWDLLTSRLAPDGIVVDGTCDEIGRRSTWVSLDRDGPRSLTLSLALRSIEVPSDVAERLPKALIHHNVPGRPIHTYLSALDQAWARAASLASYGRRQRFVASVRSLRDQGWPVMDGPARWRLGEVSVAWSAVS